MNAIMNRLREKRALEQWEYHDSVIIMKDLADYPEFSQAGYFASYEELGAQRDVPFFNTRNQGMVGPMYCNMDQTDRFPMPFICMGLSIEFLSGLQAAHENNGGSSSPNALFNNVHWLTEMPKHSSFHFQVGQDEKICTTAVMCPAGGGVTGFGGSHGNFGLSASPATTNFNSGAPDSRNFYHFQNGPIEIPKGETVRGSLRLTPYAQEVLSKLCGPGVYLGKEGVEYNIISMIRVTLYGVRGVQLRNALEY